MNHNKIYLKCFDVHFLGRNIHTINKNIEAPLVVSKEVGLEANPEKIK
jgi:hypothetical protein